MGIYERAQAKAAAIIRKYGELVTWTVVTNGAPADAAKPWAPGASVAVAHSVYVFFLTADRPVLKGLQMTPGTEIPQGYSGGLAAGDLPFDPTLKGHILRASGEKIAVEFCDPINPAGIPILFKFGYVK